MAKVIRAFRERYHDFKLYNIGDEYPEKDMQRVEFLVKEGFLNPPEKPKRSKKVSADVTTDA